MDKLLIKSYELILEIPVRFFFIKFHKKLTLKFEQAKLIDTMEFFKITEEGGIGIIKRLLKFVEEKWKMDNHIKRYVYWNREKLFEKIKQTFFEWCFAEWKSSWDNAPFSSYLAILSEKLNIDPLTMIKTYTPKQLEYITEGLVWNANETTKEWQKKNKLRLVQQKAVNRTAEQEEKIKNLLSKI